MRRQQRRSNAHGKVLTLMLAVLIICLVTGGVFAGLWYLNVYKPGELEREAADRILAMTGLGNPVKNVLDPRYHDADGDLVADPPADAKDEISPPVLTFCYVAVEDPERHRKAWEGFVAYLSKAVDRPVEYLAVTSSEDQVLALREGRLHVAGFNTGTVPIAVTCAGFVPVATLAGPDGKGTYRMELIVPVDSPIKAVSDLKGHELTLTETASNSGYRAPLALLKRDFGLLGGQDYKLRYSGGHEQSILGVAAKKYDAAAIANDIPPRLVARGQLQTSQYRVVYKSEAFPKAALGFAHNLKPELAAKVRKALLEYDWKGTPLAEFLAATSAADPTRFVPASYKDDWALVRQVDDSAGYKYEVKSAPAAATPPTTGPATRGAE